MEKKINKFIYWTPRILSILFILFLMLFSLDVFEPGLSAREIAIGLFMHNIPALILLVVLVVSWKHEIVGGVVFILAGIAFIASKLVGSRLEGGMAWWSFLLISSPAFLIGILFIINWLKKRNVRIARP